eukprot:gnl/TRDRNA2_/TRDRNA2_146616_c1_seq1.p1 gnl/TRDRNA2_/TRDRNA2_146616_c1~~gnl/TRDRNA2_/TRDRNA2_146616_c1_seq1.p1  ORF type:complete len:244 (+),score=52.46 gnl/TRDRNA2_/TRDRNA2_146616_c1_seq1:22-732(+)
MAKESWIFPFIFLLFVMFGALTVLNMLIGILCEVVSAVAAAEKEEMTVHFVETKLREVVTSLDENGDMRICKEEFMQVLENPIAARALREVGVDAVELVDYADFIFSKDSGVDEEEDESDQAYVGSRADGNAMRLSFEDLMCILLQFRGSATATVKDIVDLRKFLNAGVIRNYKQIRMIKDFMAALCERLPTVPGAKDEQPQPKGTTPKMLGPRLAAGTADVSPFSLARVSDGEAV